VTGAGPPPPPDRVRLCWGPLLGRYDFGPSHPMQPVRVSLTIALARAAGLLDHPALDRSEPTPLPDEDLLRVHAPELVAAVRRLGADPGRATPDDEARFGVGRGDTPAFPGMHEASAAVCGASVDGARAVWSGEARHAFAPAGGLHHAQRGRSAGFCVYNDCSVAIAALLDAGARRVAYIDVDVHHGDGTQWIHYADPRVMTCSIHESGLYLYPGTGFVREMGEGDAEGTAVNVPMPPLSGTRDWLSALTRVVVPLVEAFEPDVLVTQDGVDSHHLDPLAHVLTTMDAFPAMWAELHRLAHRVCDGRWLALGGGGYELFRVVPRAWALLLAEMLEAPLEGPLPEEWLAEAAAAGGRSLPSAYLADQGPEVVAQQAVRASGEAERAIAEAQMALFPHWGLTL
jgi:acetoin utilization protein AcuC